MSTALAEVAAHARQLRAGPHGQDWLPAINAAAAHVRNNMFLAVGDERVPFTLAEAAGAGRRSIVVDIDGIRWRNAAAVPSADATTLLVELRPEGADNADFAMPLRTNGVIGVRVDDAALRTFKYSIAEMRAQLPVDVQSQGWRYTIPLQGNAATDEAIDKDIVTIDLELRGRFERTKGDRLVSSLTSAAIRVRARPRRSNAPPVVPANEYGMEPEEPATPPPVPPRLDDAETAEAARELLANDKDASVTVTRFNGRTLFECGSHEVVGLGAASRPLAAVAVVQYVLNNNDTSPLGDVVLSDRTLVSRMLDASGAKNVRTAFEALYARGNAVMPSLYELLSDTAGLPAYAPHTTHDQHALVADAGGRPATGNVETDFAAVLDRCALIAQPGTVYHPSALGWAVLLFMMPGWERNTDVARTLATLAGPDHAEQVVLPASPLEPGFQSIYRLWAGIRASPAAAAHMLANVGWFGFDVGADFGWLSRLLDVRAPVNKQMAAACGGWVRTTTPDGHTVYTTSGSSERTTTVFVLAPAMGMSGVYVHRTAAAPATGIMHRLTHFMARLSSVDAGDEPEPVLRSVSAKDAARRAARLLASSANPETQLPEMRRFFLGDFVALNEPRTTLTIALKPTPPEPALRYVMTLRRDQSETAEFIVAYDPDMAPSADDPAGQPGGMRLLDPLTGAAIDVVHFEVMEGTDGSKTPFIHALGRIFSRANVSKELLARFDMTSDEARRRTILAANKAAAAQTAAAQQRAERARARAQVIRDGDQSDDDDEDIVDVVEDLLPLNEPIAIKIGDFHDALAAAPPADTARTAFGRWGAFIGTERNRAAAMVLAYPAGERMHPLGAWASGPASPYYVN